LEDRFLRLKAALTALALGTALVSAGRAQINDVSPDHWAYQDVKELADKGIILGYPDGNFLGNRTLTRYEMAALIKRMLDYLNSTYVTITENTTKVTETPPTAEVSMADLAEIRKLVDEFKVELTVIGTQLSEINAKLDKLESEVQAHDARLQGVEDAVNDPEGPVQTASRDIAKMKQLKLSGYIQARWQDRESTYSLPGVGGTERNQNYFYIRRARLAAQYTFKEYNEAKLQFDVAQGAVVAKDVYITYSLMKAKGLDMPPVFWMGQFNYPFGFEIQQSSSDRQFLERSRGERVMFAGERDRGIQVQGTFDKQSLFYQIGLVNGQGINDGTRIDGSAVTNYGFKDLNATKDVVGRLVYEPVEGKFAIGGSFYTGKAPYPTGAKDTAGKEIWGDFDKNRYGAELRLYPFKGLYLSGEYVQGQQFNPFRKNAAGLIEESTDSMYWYALAVYSFAKERNGIGVRYDYYDPDTQDPTAAQIKDVNSYIGVGTWGILFQRFLSDSTKVTFEYDMPNLPTLLNGTEQNQDLYTVQLQFKF
jgi:hypothetical protein